MGPRNPGGSKSCGMVGERREPLPAEVPVHELDAPHPGGPRVDQGRSANQEGLRPVDRTILHGRWRVLHGWFQEGPPLRDREHSARPRAIWLRGPSGGPRGVRVACQESGQERRVGWVFLGGGTGLLGGGEVPRRGAPTTNLGGADRGGRGHGRETTSGGNAPAKKRK